MKSLSMNMKAIYYPSVHISKAIKESWSYGLTRIEITYTATTLKGQEKLTS